MGDVPGLANLFVQLTGDLPTFYPAGTWRTDFFAWSLGGAPSFTAYWPAASLRTQDITTASLAGDAFAPASQGKQLVPSQNLGAWKLAADVLIDASLEPAYRGRFRLYSWAKLGPSQALSRLDLPSRPRV